MQLHVSSQADPQVLCFVLCDAVKPRMNEGKPLKRLTSSSGDAGLSGGNTQAAAQAIAQVDTTAEAQVCPYK